jgi:cobalamin biosynthesis protein CobT
MLDHQKQLEAVEYSSESEDDYSESGDEEVDEGESENGSSDSTDSEDSDNSDDGSDISESKKDDNNIISPTLPKQLKRTRDEFEEGPAAASKSIPTEVFERATKISRYQGTDGVTVMRSGRKPVMDKSKLPASSLMSRLKQFVPEMAAANEVLDAEKRSGSIAKRVMEVGDDAEDNYIEMVSGVACVDLG